MYSSSSYLRLGQLAVADDLRQDVRLAQNQDLVGAELDLGPAVLAEDDLVAFLEIHLDVLAVLVTGARPDGQDATPLRLLLRRVRKDDPAHRRLLFLEHLDDQTVTKRLKIHENLPEQFFVSVSDLLLVARDDVLGALGERRDAVRDGRPTRLVSEYRSSG